MELDQLAGTKNTVSYRRELFLQFLESKGWNVEKIADIPDVEPLLYWLKIQKEREQLQRR